MFSSNETTSPFIYNLPSSKNNNCLENHDYLNFSNNKNEGSLILIFLKKKLWVLTFKYSKKNHIDSYKKINYSKNIGSKL